jgi:hypothetical protein
MNRISDALELLTAQHEEIERLLGELTTAGPDARLFGELADKLTTHLSAEQELFYPSIAGAVPPPAELIAQHARIKRVVADLLWRELDDDGLALLRTLFSHHIREQEGGLFMAVAEAMPAAALCGVGEQLRAWSERSLCIAA